MLTEDEIVAELNAVTDNMAFNSEDGGDTDADDDTIYTNIVQSNQLLKITVTLLTHEFGFIYQIIK